MERVREPIDTCSNNTNYANELDLPSKLMYSIMINGSTKATADHCGIKMKAITLTATTPEMVDMISSCTLTAYSSQ